MIFYGVARPVCACTAGEKNIFFAAFGMREVERGGDGRMGVAGKGSGPERKMFSHRQANVQGQTAVRRLEAGSQGSRRQG
jgi:hypothetical protein